MYLAEWRAPGTVSSLFDYPLMPMVVKAAQGAPRVEHSADRSGESVNHAQPCIRQPPLRRGRLRTRVSVRAPASLPCRSAICKLAATRSLPSTRRTSVIALVRIDTNGSIDW